MKNNLKKGVALTIAMNMMLCLVACGSSNNPENNTSVDSSEVADKIVYANFYSEEGQDVQAVAMKDGLILFAGNKEDAEQYMNKSTEVIDYTDQYAMPGFIDGHTHSYVSAENTICDFNLVNCQKAEECVAIINKYVKENPKDFYIGYGWLDSMFEGGMPTAELLEKIDTDSPIYIKSEDCHSCWTNSAMMERCHITKDTENPIGGVVEHYKNGEPAGCFRDTAMDLLIKPNVPVYSVEQYKEILEKSMNDYIALGYTAYNDVLIDVTSADNIVEAYHELDQEGKLKAYVNATYIVNNDEKIFDNLEHIKELSDKTQGEHFSLNGVKFFMDGITESCTSYMKEPYNNNPENYGVDRWVGEENTKRLYEATTKCNDLGLIAHFHAIGDAAVGKALDAIAYSKEHTTHPEIRNAMTHIQFITDEDIKRFAELDVVASCDYGWCYADNGEMYDDPTYQNIEFANLGKERTLTQEMKYKSLEEAGVVTAFATDFPATSNVNPFLCIEIGNTRYFDGIQSTICNEKESVSVPDEVKAITENTAYQLYHEEDFGKLEEGLKANFIIVDQDITQIDAEKISDTKVLESFIDGESVYKNAQEAKESEDVTK